jgi:hypothetical protein
VVHDALGNSPGSAPTSRAAIEQGGTPLARTEGLRGVFVAA